MSNPPANPEDHFLIYFDRIVLCRYRSRPNLFRVQEDDMGGVVESIVKDSEEGSSSHPYFRVRFGFRELSDDIVCIAAFGPDLESLPDNELAAWSADRIEAPSFASQDAAFNRWSQRYLHGSWQSENGPLQNLEQELRRIQAMTEFEFGEPLFRDAHNPALRNPVAENTESFTLAMLELYRLVVDGLSLRVLEKIAEKLEKNLAGLKPGETRRTMNTLKELLPSELHPIVHTPLRKCSDARNKIHGVPSEPARTSPAFKTFQDNASTIFKAIEELRHWLEQSLQMSGERCVARTNAMKYFPRFDGPLRPKSKHEDFEKVIGKTIDRVEAGEFIPGEGCHNREAVVFHFTDGTALAIDIGCNAGNLESQFPGLEPSMFNTSLMPMLAPDPRS